MRITGELGPAPQTLASHVSRLFLIYAVVELAVIVALVSTIGFGWTVLALLGTFLLGSASGRDGRFAAQAPTRAAAIRPDRTAAARSPTARWSRWARRWFSFPGWSPRRRACCC